MRRLQLADTIGHYARRRAAATGGEVTWNKEHPEGAALLEWAALYAIELGLLKNA
ncbi:MAG: hypothetical protein KF821_09005 [Anaerolineales bacterium]|nr:hypothetical protein [Anaerolineales bacterium]